MNSRPVMIVTELDDPTADLVIAELNKRDVPVVRFDPGDFPGGATISAHAGGGRVWHGILSTPTRSARLDGVRALYYRRPSPYTFPGLDERDARFATIQARHGLDGVLAALPGCLYVNHPSRNLEAEFKPAQLATAVRIGLCVPATLITNDPDEARRFAKENSPIVYKALRVPPYDVDGQRRTVWVEEVDLEEIDDTVSLTAHLFQARVDKVADVRVTVVGDSVFCVRIDSGLLDWRRHYDQLSYSVVEPPAGLARTLRLYLNQFGLAFGAFDFAIEREGDWVFLECNPNGQWAWLEQPTGLPMCAALADLLERGTR